MTLRKRSGQPFLLTAGFFETHRPYPRDRYQPADSATVDPPDYLPDTPEVRDDLADFYGSISTADDAVGRILDTLAETGLDANTWVVFFTDHGPALPRAKSTLYDAGTGIALLIRPPTGRRTAPAVYDELFQRRRPGSDVAGAAGPGCAGRNRGHVTRARPRRAGYAGRSGARADLQHEDLSRLVRSDSRNPHKGVQLHRELRAPASCWTCRGISSRVRRVWRLLPSSRRHVRSANSTTYGQIPPRPTTCSPTATRAWTPSLPNLLSACTIGASGRVT